MELQLQTHQKKQKCYQRNSIFKENLMTIEKLLRIIITSQNKNDNNEWGLLEVHEKNTDFLEF